MKPEKMPVCSACGRVFKPLEPAPTSSSYDTGVTFPRKLLPASSAGSLALERSGFRQPFVLVAASASRLTKFTLDAGSAAVVGAATPIAKDPSIRAFGITFGK
jgi:hypothetical protein